MLVHNREELEPSITAEAFRKIQQLLAQAIIVLLFSLLRVRCANSCSKCALPSKDQT